MKRTILYIIFACLGASAYAQSSSDAPSSAPKDPRDTVKDYNEYLPAWAIDASYRYGGLKQNIEMIDMAAAYKNNISTRTNFSDVAFSDGSSHGANLQLVRFFGKGHKWEGRHNRRWGVGLGINWYAQKGRMTLDTFNAQYEALDSSQNTFRQVIRNNGPLVENVRLSGFTIPLMLKYKHQLPGSRFGFTIDAGPFLGVSTLTKHETVASFDYEAVYKFDNAGNYVYDAEPGFDNTSQLITEDFWNVHRTSDIDVNAYFQRKNDEGMNVGLDKVTKNEGSNTYTKLSWGWMVQPSITYQLSYNVTFMLGGYFTQQYLGNKNNTSYMLTDNVGEYNAITAGISKNTASSLGFNVGFRIFFGEKPDRDGDKFFDAGDDCPMQKGDATFGGCPDYDGDGIRDSEDKCPQEAGKSTANGCPDEDGDGIKDEEDKCRNKFGRRTYEPELAHLNGCPIMDVVKAYAESQNLELSEKKVEVIANDIRDQFDVLKTDIIHFDVKKSTILEQNYFALDEAVDNLTKYPDRFIFISGHTDSTGSYKDNLKLSKDRAEAVSKYLQAKGIAPDRIIAIGYGSRNPFTGNSTPEERARNRRTEMLLLLPIKSKK